MKLTAVIMLVALLTAFVVMITAAGERKLKARPPGGYVADCAEPNACPKFCKSQGFQSGYCLHPRLRFCLCT
ncbi:uncharacterized protein LOC142563837 isoform X2 [Dermacentor variabilis]|uniref:uncharacterized protein LOC142563837 isoform X2 n=1 Tax=Dermacentor variabilis TaxID=34621 RepID=UPI003F5B755E